jgi:magnesium-transporting ATPase (P-type)
VGICGFCPSESADPHPSPGLPQSPSAASSELLAAASGGYFLVVVATQTANAFACRSTRRPPWQLGWCANRLLCVAVAVEFAAALVMLWTPLAHTLGQADPGLVGWGLAALAAVVLLLVDAGWKAVRGLVAAPRDAGAG